MRAHIDAMQYGHLDAGIYSWWGAIGYPMTDLRFWRYLAAARTTPFRWAIYHEREGYENPSVERIRADLEFVRNLYASKPAYVKIDGRFVVFVYGGPNDSCEATARRWREANTVGAYIVLKAFDGYGSCAVQPDAWHQYSADLGSYGLGGDAFMISPGFDEPSEASPRLLLNEWPEGTSVESAREWATPSGYGAYLDVLHELIP